MPWCSRCRSTGRTRSSAFNPSSTFSVLFSILAFWLTSAHRVFTWRWCLGAACAFCAVFTCAGGVITGAMVAGLSVLKLIADRRDWRRELAGVATGVAILAVGAAIASPPIAGHEPLRAHSVVEFLQALATNMAWPWIGERRAAVLMWLPVALLLVPLLRRPRSLTVNDCVTLAVSGWVILNGVAVAYGRGAGAPVPASRYMDFLSLGLIANLMALTALLDRLRRASARRLAYGLLGLWLALAAVGVDRLVARTGVELGHFRNFYASHTGSVRAFVVTGHREEFLAKRPLYDLPFPDAPTLVGLLENPVFRRILPATLREPLPVHVKTSTNEAFVQSGPFVQSLRTGPAGAFLVVIGRTRQERPRQLPEPAALVSVWRTSAPSRFRISGMGTPVSGVQKHRHRRRHAHSSRHVRPRGVGAPDPRLSGRSVRDHRHRRHP